MAARLQHMRFDSLYSSDLLRATETAEIVAAALARSPSGSACAAAAVDSAGALAGAAVRLEPRLRERHLGVLQGLTRAQAAEQQPEAYRALAESVGPCIAVSGTAQAARPLVVHFALGAAAHSEPPWPPPGLHPPGRAHGCRCVPPVAPSAPLFSKAGALGTHALPPPRPPPREAWRAWSSWRPGRSRRWRSWRPGTLGSACWWSPMEASCRRPTGKATRLGAPALSRIAAPWLSTKKRGASVHKIQCLETSARDTDAGCSCMLCSRWQALLGAVEQQRRLSPGCPCPLAGVQRGNTSAAGM